MTEETEQLRQPVTHLRLVEVTSEEFAQSCWAFYKALLDLGVDEEFAKRLTVAFTRRP